MADGDEKVGGYSCERFSYPLLQKTQHDCICYTKEEDLGEGLTQTAKSKKADGKLTKHGCKICGSALRSLGN